MRYIYADENNGCILIDSSEVGDMQPETCNDMDDVRQCLSREVFEQVIAVPESLLDAIDSEYGIRGYFGV